MGGSEELIDQLGILRFFLKPEQLRFQGLQILLGFRRKIGQHLGIQLRHEIFIRQLRGCRSLRRGCLAYFCGRFQDRSGNLWCRLLLRENGIGDP